MYNSGSHCGDRRLDPAERFFMIVWSRSVRVVFRFEVLAAIAPAKSAWAGF